MALLAAAPWALAAVVITLVIAVVLPAVWSKSTDRRNAAMHVVNLILGAFRPHSDFPPPRSGE